jgi:FkbM family methyltransferase
MIPLSNILQSIATRAVRPYSIRELYGWGVLYGLLIGHAERDHFWANAPHVITIDKRTRYSIELDLSWWSDRLTYFPGRWADLPAQLILDTPVNPGGLVVDVGANRGSFALYASRRVGESGRVICFEPNPECVTLLKRAIEINSIRNIEVFNLGLSDSAGTLTLTIPKINSGEATFGATRYFKGETHAVDAEVRRGDSIISALAPTLIKIDVGGFEARVLRGLSTTIAESRPLIITEILSSHLTDCNSSVDELVQLMTSQNYRAFEIGLSTDHSDWTLAPLTCQADYDALWIPDERMSNELDARVKRRTGFTNGAAAHHASNRKDDARFRH